MDETRECPYGDGCRCNGPSMPEGWENRNREAVGLPPMPEFEVGR